MMLVIRRAAHLVAIALIASLTLMACSTSGAASAAGQPEGTQATQTESQTDGSAESSVANDPVEQTTQEEPLLAITVNGTTFVASFEDNSSAEAFADLLQEGPLTLSLHDYGGFEKVGPLGTNLPTNDEQITTQPGDVILYQGNQITIYYDTNSWNFTRLAHIDGATRDDLLAAFGEGDVEATFELQQDSETE